MSAVQNQTVDSYRSLLAAYPARLRRRHGAEIIATLVEMAGPDGEPSRRARLHLALDGLRERFRPPHQPLAVVAAMLALAIGGAVGASIGSFAGSFLYAKLPAAATLTPAIAQPGSKPGYRSELRTSVLAQDELAAGVAPREVVEQAQKRLSADGWATTEVVPGDGNFHFRASGDGTELDVYAYTGGSRLIQIAGWPARPALYLPLTIAGLLLGLTGGWLVAAALAHRIAAARRPRLTAATASVGLLLPIPAAVMFFLSLGYYLFATEPVGDGGLLHTDGGFTFGPTIDLIRGLDLSPSLYTFPYFQLALLGFALITTAAIAAQPGTPAGQARLSPTLR